MDLSMLKHTGAVIGAISASVGALYGAGSFVETRYAHSTDVVLVSMRLEQKILTDRASQLQQRLWKIEDRYGIDLHDAPETVKEEVRQIKEELADLDQEMQAQRQEFQQMQQGYYGKDYKRAR